MKVVKIKKSDLNLHLEDLLKKLGLVEKKQAYPECLLMSKEDQKVLKNNITKKIKKKYPHISKKNLSAAVGLYWLNLGPSILLTEAIKPGYAVVLDHKTTEK